MTEGLARGLCSFRTFHVHLDSVCFDQYPELETPAWKQPKLSEHERGRRQQGSIEETVPFGGKNLRPTNVEGLQWAGKM